MILSARIGARPHGPILRLGGRRCTYASVELGANSQDSHEG